MTELRKQAEQACAFIAFGDMARSDAPLIKADYSRERCSRTHAKGTVSLWNSVLLTYGRFYIHRAFPFLQKIPLAADGGKGKKGGIGGRAEISLPRRICSRADPPRLRR